MRRGHGLLLLLIMLGGLQANGCSSGILASSPSTVVKDSYMACNAGNYSKAESYLSSDLKNVVSGGMGMMAGGIKGICDNASHNGTISEVDIRSESIRGEGATVVADIHFKDGSSKAADITQLIKENGDWKISPGGN